MKKIKRSPLYFLHSDDSLDKCQTKSFGNMQHLSCWLSSTFVPPTSCLNTVLLMLSVNQEAVNTFFKVIGLTRIGIKPESTAPEADAPTTRPSEL